MSHTRATSVVLGLFVSGVLGGAWAGQAAAQRVKDPYTPLETLVRVISIVERGYVEEIDREVLIEAAIDGVLERLDRHSTWLDAATWQGLQRETEGAYTGIGVEVTVGADGPRIVRVLPGSPAEREGLAPGDRLLAIDGTPVESADADTIATALLGPRGDRATLTIQRDGWEAPQDVATTRDEVRTPALELGRLPLGGGADAVYVRLRQFQRGAATELTAALQRERPGKALILDLRGNPGGLLQEAVAVADLFLDEGVIVSTWGRLEKERAVHEATPGGLPASLPVVVLVNGLSASASEIVAAALQDTGRATLVGAPTYGKGSVQTVFEHTDGSALKLTIGRYLTPSGEPVAPRTGRTPDVEVRWPVEKPPEERLRDGLIALDMPADTRAELLGLLADLPPSGARRHPKLPWGLPLAARVEADPQLRAAVDVAAQAVR